MSIDDLIVQLHGEGKLRLLQPLLASDPCARPLLVTPELFAAVTPPFSRRYARLRQDLDRFVSGGPIEWDYLKPLQPFSAGVWEIKSVKPSPSLRVFGRFVMRDVFFASHYERRDLLEGFKSIFFRREIRHCKQCWNRLFGTFEPLLGHSIHDYVSGTINNPSAYDR